MQSHAYVQCHAFIWALGEGMGGAQFWQDFISLARSVGFSTPHLVSASNIVIYNNDLKAKAGNRRRH